jgi:hypothetical protein
MLGDVAPERSAVAIKRGFMIAAGGGKRRRGRSAANQSVRLSCWILGAFIESLTTQD